MKKALILTAAMLFCANLFCITPLCDACTRGDLNQVKVELKYGADVNKIDADGTGHTPLIISCMRGDRDIEIVKLLIEKGADLNKADKYGTTPLRAAGNNKEIRDLLIQKGAK